MGCGASMDGFSSKQSGKEEDLIETKHEKVRQIQSSTIKWVTVMVNATFNNISVISWRSFLLVEETRVPGEKH